jgi:hypothetical protein
MPFLDILDTFLDISILFLLSISPNLTLLIALYRGNYKKLLFYPLNYGVFGTRSRGKLMPLGAGLAILEAEL